MAGDHWSARLAALVLSVVLAAAASAVEPFTVEDIRVEGLERISPGTVFNYLPVKVGDQFDDSRSAEAVRALFATGLFSDIRLERDGNVLVVVVRERPTIASIEFEGNNDIKTEDLLKGLRDVGFAEGEVYDEAKLDRMKQELSRQYYAHGKYGMTIDTEVEPVEGNRVAVRVKIHEGEPAKIREINIVGNQAFSDRRLLRLFKLRPTNWLSFFRKDDQYSREKLSGDLETLRSFYLDRGYINFNVDSTQVSITPDKQHIYITVNVTEGERYTVGDVKLAGDLVVPPEELFKVVKTRRGMTFSRKALTETSKAITERLGDEGYAFANVNAIPDVDEEHKRVSITYFVDPGKRVYVRRINFVGNTKTRDEVLRREMRQLEGAPIATSKVERSKVRLQRLGFFTDVNIETKPVPDSPDQVDLDVSVTERPSGNLMLGLGFSQSQGLILNTSVAQDNFLGSGKRIEFAFNNSDVNRQFVFGYTNPYWTIDGVSMGFRLAYQSTNAGDANITQFDSTVRSVGVNFGVPISEYNFVNLSGSFERTTIETGFLVSNLVNTFLLRQGNDFDILRLGASYSYDTRNSAIFPTRGVLHRIRTQIASPPGDLRYYKVDYDTRWFVPLVDEYTLLLKGRIGYGDGYGDTDDLPFFENFFAGGPRTVRGYKENSLGPQDFFGNAEGGNKLLLGNAELILPIPFLKDLKSARVTAFFDAGNVYGPGEGFNLDELRMSTGISGVWLSPFGVLTVSLAKPFNDQSGDETQAFQFTFGTSF